MSGSESVVGADALTFVFVDLAGFTALTDAHGDQEAANQVARFCSLAREALVGETIFVKSVGDAVMLAAESPSVGLRSALALLKAVDAEPNFPLARGGVHTGTAVRSGADFFGAGVNVASRITGRAAGGQLVMTEQPALAARTLGLQAHELGRVALRNVSTPIELFSLDVTTEGQLVDPVCHMTVDRQAAAGSLSYCGHDFWFCSLACAGAFAATPETYVSSGSG